jgi:hypothetical protein
MFKITPEDENRVDSDGMPYAGIAINQKTGDKIGLTSFCPNDDETEIECGFNHFASNVIVLNTIKITKNAFQPADIIELTVNGKLQSFNDVDPVLQDWIRSNAEMHCDLVSGSMSIQE